MDSSFDKAWLLYRQSRFRLAIETLQSGLLQDPNDADSHALWAICLAGEKNFPGAETKIREAVTYDPESDFVNYAHAWVLASSAARFGAIEQLKRLDEAKRAIDEAIRLSPFDADYYDMRARLMLNTDDPIAAKEALANGLAVNPEHPGCVNLKAVMALSEGKIDEALSWSRQALAVAPEEAVSHTMLGRALSATGDHEQALVHLREALRINPNDDDARSSLVTTLKSRSAFFRFLKRPSDRWSELTDSKRNRIRAMAICATLAILCASLIFRQWQTFTVVATVLIIVVVSWVVAKLASDTITFLALRQDEDTRKFLGEDERSEMDFCVLGLTWLAVVAATIFASKWHLGVAAIVNAGVGGVPVVAERMLRDVSFRDSKRLANSVAIVTIMFCLLAFATSFWSTAAAVTLLFATSIASLAFAMFLFAAK